MSALLTIDPRKYARLANRIPLKAIETTEEYNRMVAAVEALMDKGESNLMETSGVTTKDLLSIFGTRGRVSEVLNGKRAISKAQAKRLAAQFHVTADLFI